MNAPVLRAPFPYFGGKRDVAELVWARLGTVKQYIEPFCGSAAMLLGAKTPASLEVVNDYNGFIANFWRTVKHQPAEVARWADYPVSHIDQGARHVWLMEQRARIGALLQDPNDPGDAQVAGWWLWGQCCWIGSGWCEWTRPDSPRGQRGYGDSGDGQDGLVEGLGQIPHAGNAGMGIQALGKIPHASDAGRGALLTSAGRTAWEWLHKLADRLERVRVTHGTWDRCLNSHYGAESTAVFLDPPYRAYESLYGADGCADAVEVWAREHADLRVALCGHIGDYPTLGDWCCVPWTRKRLTYSGSGTTDKEAIWFSPACLKPDVSPRQTSVFDLMGGAA
jgi:DNA adenine methylase